MSMKKYVEIEWHNVLAPTILEAGKILEEKAGKEDGLEWKATEVAAIYSVAKGCFIFSATLSRPE